MTALRASFLAGLQAAADEAASAEAEFRRDAQRRLATLETERAFAFRRLNLMRAIADAVEGAESEEIAVAKALAMLRAKLGWQSDSEARDETVSRFAAVARAVHAGAPAREAGTPGPDAQRPLADFEAWYAETRGTPFWVLFERDIPETPLVDF